MGTETVEDRFRAVGTTLKGELRIDAVIAEGGFGLVYRATHLGLDRPAAVKVLKTPSEYNDDARRAFTERFKLEARTVTRVSHPAVVQVLDFGVSTFPNGEEAAWTAMEWIEGKTLEDELRARRKQGGRHPIDAMALLRPIFEAVAVAHDEGIAHRDLKPANIMIVRGKRTTAARLLDFGIAKLMDAGEEAGSGHTRTASTMVACSPRYAAPEQLSSARTGPWSDVHALAMILSEVLTDRVGYAGKDTTSVFAEALSPVRPTPAKRGIDVGAWEPILLKALAIRPDDRFANAGDLLAALDAALPGATHPHASETEARLSSAGAAPSAVRTSATLAAPVTAPSGSGPLLDDDDDAPPPPAPYAGGTQELPAAPPAGTQRMPEPAVPPGGNTTLRGVSSNSAAPAAPTPPRSARMIVAGVAALVVVVTVGFALLRRDARTATAAPAPVAEAPPAPVAPAAPAPAAPPAAPVVEAAPPAPPNTVDAAVAAVANAPAEEPDAPRHRSRRHRSTRRGSTSQEGYNIE
ncbi:MAG: serine/threonine-protein kinase [Polyangiales bacterium]